MWHVFLFELICYFPPIVVIVIVIVIVVVVVNKKTGFCYLLFIRADLLLFTSYERIYGRGLKFRDVVKFSS